MDAEAQAARRPIKTVIADLIGNLLPLWIASE
jgi:hypothetical protein